MTTPWTSSYEDLISGMKQLAHSGGGKDLRLSEAARQNYLNLIQEYRTELTQHLNKIATLTDYGNVGQFASANHTKSTFKNDVHDPRGAHPVLQSFIDDYLEQFENTVNAACSRTQAEDQSR
jgi:hypothetical protein